MTGTFSMYSLPEFFGDSRVNPKHDLKGKVAELYMKQILVLANKGIEGK